MPTTHRKGAKSKALKLQKQSKKQRGQVSRLEKTLAVDLVETRDHIEGELAAVRPVYSKKVKHKAALREKKQPAAAPTPSQRTGFDPLNPREESRRQLRARTGGKSIKGAGPAGPGIERRAKEVKQTSTVCSLLQKIAAKRAAKASA